MDTSEIPTEYRFDVITRGTRIRVRINCDTLEEAARHAVEYGGGSIQRRDGILYRVISGYEQHVAMDAVIAADRGGIR